MRSYQPVVGRPLLQAVLLRSRQPRRRADVVRGQLNVARDALVRLLRRVKLLAGDHGELGYLSIVPLRYSSLTGSTFGAGRSATATWAWSFTWPMSGASEARKLLTRGAKLPSVVPCPAPNSTPASSPRWLKIGPPESPWRASTSSSTISMRKILLRGVVRGAAAGGDAVLAAAVAVDREQVAGPRRLRRDFHRLDRRPPDHQRREVPIGIDFERPGVRAEAAGEHNFDDASANRARRASS